VRNAASHRSGDAEGLRVALHTIVVAHDPQVRKNHRELERRGEVDCIEPTDRLDGEWAGRSGSADMLVESLSLHPMTVAAASNRFARACISLLLHGL